MTMNTIIRLVPSKGFLMMGCWWPPAGEWALRRSGVQGQRPWFHSVYDQQPYLASRKSVSVSFAALFAVPPNLTQIPPVSLTGWFCLLQRPRRNGCGIPSTDLATQLFAWRVSDA